MIAASLKDGDELVDILLVKSADPSIKTNNGQTALHFAASKSNLETAKKLFSKKASARIKDRRGQLPLHRAAAIGNVPIVKLLLEHRSPVDATDIDGWTALHHGRLQGDRAPCVMLADHRDSHRRRSRRHCPSTPESGCHNRQEGSQWCSGTRLGARCQSMSL